MKKILFIVLALITLSYSNVGYSSKEVASTSITDDIIFSDDMWGPENISLIHSKPLFLPEDTEFDIPSPPSNTSLETQYELFQLNTLKGLRTPETLEKIHQENEELKIPDEFEVGGLTKQFLYVLYRDITFFTVREKLKFKRARPSQLDPGLDPVIDVPTHAAYPSGHGGQSYFIALVLSHLDPENSEKYMDYAMSVGRNREIAGVHYPSDTRAGQSLAFQVFEKMKENPTVIKMLSDAKKEWD